MEILFYPYLWLILALSFNVGHLIFHVAFYFDYNGKNSAIYDGIVGYLGALFVFILVFIDHGTVQFPGTIAVVIGSILFMSGIMIYVKAQLDFKKYIKQLPLIDRGIYHYIRHPMYFGASIFFIGVCMVSRSYLGLFTFWFWVLLLAVCGHLEGVKLKRDLPSGQYRDYMKRTWF